MHICLLLGAKESYHVTHFWCSCRNLLEQFLMSRYVGVNRSQKISSHTKFIWGHSCRGCSFHYHFFLPLLPCCPSPFTFFTALPLLQGSSCFIHLEGLRSAVNFVRRVWLPNSSCCISSHNLQIPVP